MGPGATQRDIGVDDLVRQAEPLRMVCHNNQLTDSVTRSGSTAKQRLMIHTHLSPITPAIQLVLHAIDQQPSRRGEILDVLNLLSLIDTINLSVRTMLDGPRKKELQRMVQRLEAATQRPWNVDCRIPPMMSSCEEGVKGLAVLQDNDISDLLELKSILKKS